MDAKVHENEVIKATSNYLRGTLRESMADELTGALAPADAQLSKFHGFYEQDDRDLRQQRQEKFLEPYYSFMLRARLPGGVCSAPQWQAIDSVAQRLGNGSIRLTTRQTFQYHGILKRNLKPLIKDINAVMIDSIGGCGDVNRNVLCNPNPVQSELHAEVYRWARSISDALLPKTQAYHEIWLDGEQVEGGEDEPLYGDTYLPRKFKTAVAIPPYNDVDVYTNDLGFVAIVEAGQLVGFNVLAGGGMGTTHGDTSTFPRLADELGFVEPHQVIAIAKAIVAIQRDNGNRTSRHHARLKYTIESMGTENFRHQVEQLSEVTFAPLRPVSFEHQGDRYGWVQGSDGNWHLTLYIENGRIADLPDAPLMSGLRSIAAVHRGDFRITASQNLVIAGVPLAQKELIEALARNHGLLKKQSSIRLNSIACVALPTCPQAMAEAERYFPEFMTEIEKLAAKHKLEKLGIVMRMTGCPNGCARPFVAEVGLVGKGPGSYNLMLGGDGRGLRINRLYRENLKQAEILEELDNLFNRYAEEHLDQESFGDFTVRAGLVSAVINPAEDFHD